MKTKIFSRLIILLVILLANVIICTGQTIPCDPCSGVDWSNEITYQSSICNASVTYQIRLCGDPLYEIKITHMGSLQPIADMINLQACLIYELLKSLPHLASRN